MRYAEIELAGTLEDIDRLEIVGLGKVRKQVEILIRKYHSYGNAIHNIVLDILN